MPRSSGGSHTSEFPCKADSPRLVDDGRAHAEDGRGGSERWTGRNPRSSVTAMATITAPLSSRVAAADRNLEGWVPGRRDEEQKRGRGAETGTQLESRTSCVPVSSLQEFL